VLFAACRFDRPAQRGTVLAVDRPGESVFAPSPALLGALATGRAGWRLFERRYTEEMRALYRRGRDLWVELVEQAAVEDVTLTGAARGDERTVRCPRRVLFDLLVAVAADRGLRIDPETDALQITLLGARRREVLIAAGLPLICPVCHRPASSDLAVPGRDGYGYCSTVCREREAAQRRASQWTPDSARRP
jgi:uncharacterized protein YeaO (DUF488 family)